MDYRVVQHKKALTGMAVGKVEIKDKYFLR